MSLFPFNLLGGFALPQYLAQVESPPQITTPDAEEKTPRQFVQWGQIRAEHIPGYAKAPPGGLAVWRLMDRDETLTLARACVWGPILAGTRTFEINRPDGQPAPRKTPAVGDGVQADPLDKRRDFIKGVLEPLLAELIERCLIALSLGYQPFEVVWQPLGGGKWGFAKFKDLLQEETTLLVDPAGNLAGIRNGGADLDPIDAFSYANDPRAGNHYGESRHENCRQAWWEDLQARVEGMRLDHKASGIQAILRGPATGTFNTSTGVQTTAQVLQAAGTALTNGQTIYLPLNHFDEKTAKGDAKLMEMELFKAERWDWGNTADASKALQDKRVYIDALKFRAWHRPEREGLEALHSSKADAEAHGLVGVNDSDLVHEAICRAINRGQPQTLGDGLVNRLLVQNFGPEARDSVYLKPAPLSDPGINFIRQIILNLSANTQTAPSLMEFLDMEQLLETGEIQVRQEVLDGTVDPLAPKPAPPAPIAPPIVPAGGSQDQPGNGKPGNGKPGNGKPGNGRFAPAGKNGNG